MRYLITISLLLILARCKKNVEEESIWVNATVVSTNDINCHLPDLYFADDSIKIRSFTGYDGLIYVVKGLPSELNVQGKKVLLQIAMLKPEESIFCITYGPGPWPGLKVLTATAR